MLTDLHVHLRPDEPGASPNEYFNTQNAERYRAAARERGIEELGVSEHIYRFRQALEPGHVRFGVRFERRSQRLGLVPPGTKAQDQPTAAVKNILNRRQGCLDARVIGDLASIV